MSGRDIQPSSSFAGDDGSADPALAAVLAEVVAGTAPLTRVVSLLATRRVLVPILAQLEVAELSEQGLVVDKEASAGVVALQASDGRQALPVFTSIESMRLWRTDARPVAVEAARAALSAVSEEWSLLVVDPGGPATVLIPRPAVWALARGLEWQAAVADDGVVDPEVAAAVATALDGTPHLLGVSAVAGVTAEVRIELELAAGLDRAQLDATLQWVNAALADSTVVAERVDSIELRILEAGR